MILEFWLNRGRRKEEPPRPKSTEDLSETELRRKEILLSLCKTVISQFPLIHPQEWSFSRHLLSDDFLVRVETKIDADLLPKDTQGRVQGISEVMLSWDSTGPDPEDPESTAENTKKVWNQWEESSDILETLKTAVNNELTAQGYRLVSLVTVPQYTFVSSVIQRKEISGATFSFRIAAI